MKSYQKHLLFQAHSLLFLVKLFQVVHQVIYGDPISMRPSRGFSYGVPAT